MKNTSKVLGFAAIIAAIGFMLMPLTGCPGTSPDDSTKTETTKIVATPTANPPAGTYTSAQSVTLTSTEGATIYYTLDGTAPTTSSTQYSSAISISVTTTLKAFAIKEDLDDSAVLTAVYTINLPASIPELIMGKWSDGNITTNGGEQWFKFTTDVAQTRVYMHFLATGTLTDVYVQLYNNDQTTTVGDRANLSTGLLSSSSSRTVTASTEYYVKVTPYSSSNKGTYKIGVVNASYSTTTPSLTAIPTTVTTSAVALTANTWADQTLDAAYSEKWFKFTTGAGQTSAYIHFDRGTLRGLYAQVYTSDGTSVGDSETFFGSTFSASRTVTASNDYYIMVFYSSTGTYKIGVNTSSTPPAITVPTTSATSLTADTWSTNGNITTAGGEQWFSFSATAATQYIHLWGDTLTDILVRVYVGAGTQVGDPTNLDGILRRNTSRTLSNGTTYYIRVTPYLNTSSGTYKIGFNATEATPVVETVGASPVSLTNVNTWYDGSITAINGAQWFKFTSTATTQYIYFQAGTMTNIYIQLYTTDGRMVGTRSSLSTGTYSAYSSKTVTASTEYYIKVTPYYSSATTSGALGAFKLGFGTTSTVPAP